MLVPELDYDKVFKDPNQNLQIVLYQDPIHIGTTDFPSHERLYPQTFAGSIRIILNTRHKLMEWAFIVHHFSFNIDTVMILF